MDNKCCGKNVTINMGNCCGELQGQMRGTVLWMNSNPMADFASQIITLSSDEYDMLEWIYGEPQSAVPAVYSGKSIKKYGTTLNVPNVTDAAGYLRLATRIVKYLTDTTCEISDCVYLPSVNNCLIKTNLIIPLYVIGYTTGYFD